MEGSSSHIPYKQVLAVIVLAILLALLGHFALMLLNALLSVHDWIAGGLASVFSGSAVGNFIQQCLSYLVLPFLIAGIAAAIYGLIRKKFIPHFMSIVWGVWLVLATALLLR